MRDKHARAFFAGAIPPFVSGVILQLVFAVQLAWFPPGGVYPPGQQGFDLGEMIQHLILPVTAVAIQTVRYLLIPAYRSQFEEMGFMGVSESVKSALDAEGIDGAARQVPDELLKRVSGYGSPSQARAMFERLGQELDLAIVRIVPAQEQIESIVAVLEATHPK